MIWKLINASVRWMCCHHMLYFKQLWLPNVCTLRSRDTATVVLWQYYWCNRPMARNVQKHGKSLTQCRINHGPYIQE